MSWLGKGEVERLRRSLKLEIAARESAEERAAQLVSGLDAVPAGLLIADKDGNVVFRNLAASRGGHADVLLEEAIEGLLAAALRGEHGEKQLKLFGPPQLVLLIRGIPLAGSGALAVIDDLTDRARLDAVRTDFVANISHELKTPVGALAVLAEALVDSDDSEVNRRLAAKLVVEAHRAASTIDDLLSLSRIELDDRRADRPVSLVEVIAEATSRHRLNAESAGIELQIGEVTAKFVDGDDRELASAISNLIDNAVKYSNRGGKVVVSAVSEGAWVDIKVVDEGIGIPPRDLDRVFERFYRVDRARSRETGGNGLGLAIVRHVATNHGGQVSVLSREGEGSTFSLRIPLPAIAPADRN